MPYIVSENILNASTVDILNVIRQNSSASYQAAIPEIETIHEIGKVGAPILGHPALANEFVHALVNEIALKRMQSVVFNNPLKRYKKGFLEYGETVEEIFVELARGMKYSAEKGAAREMKRYIPDVKTAFHIINWQALYPVTVQRKDLEKAFRTGEGVRNLIENIIQSVYTGAEYDEYLLFKYLIIKGVNNGGMKIVNIDTSDIKNEAVAYRGYVNALPFPSKLYNARGVQTATPKDRLCIFMDAMHNAEFDVEVLAAAFNMDKADFLATLEIIDSFAEFDNDRFELIRAESDGLEEVTEAELAVMADVTAVLCDTEYFQVYDHVFLMNDDEIAAGLYWNYFLHVWKTVSFSPFSNAIAFSGAKADEAADEITLTLKDSIVQGETNILVYEGDAVFKAARAVDAAASQDGTIVAVTDYGAVYVQANEQADAEITIEAVGADGTLYVGTFDSADVSEIVLTPADADDNEVVPVVPGG